MNLQKNRVLSLFKNLPFLLLFSVNLYRVWCLIRLFSTFYFPVLVIFVISIEAVCKRHLVLSLNMPCPHAILYFPLILPKKITLLNIKYPIAVHAHFLSINYLGVESLCALILWYATCDQMTSCLQIIFLSGKSKEHSIILDFLWKSTFLKIGFSNFYSISSLWEIINIF